MAYNSVRQLTQTVQDGITVNYDYDESGNVDKISYPSDGTTKALVYDYDSYNRLQDIMVQTGSNTAKKVRDYSYTSSSKISTVTNYLKFDTSGTDTEKINYTYNSVGNPSAICYNINGTDKEKYTLIYDKNGNIKNETAYTNYDTAKTITKQYQYDEIGELLSATNNDSSTNTTKTTSYTYDLVGNRLTMTQDKDVHSYIYDNFNHETFEYKNRSTDPNPVTTITYDDNGNEKTDVSRKDVDGKQKTITTNYTFNSANKLVSETVDDGTTKSNINNYYDAAGNRVKEHVTATNDDGSTNNAQPFEIKYFYLGQSLLFTADKDNNKGTENILTPSGQIAASKRFDGVYANNYYFYNYDARGSVTNILNPDGKVVKGYTYDEFGNTTETDSTKNNGFKNDVKFTGAIEDQSAGLYYMNARFYNPTSGRFISQDSYSGSPSEPWTQHLYSYTCNNPVNMIDPTGHLPRTILFDDSGHSYTLHPNVDGYQNTDSQYCNLTIDEEEKNRNSAVAYAEYYCNSISGHDGYEYCHPDCANFVSQCLYAGGFKMTGSWYWKGYKVPNCINGFKTPIDTFKHIFGMKSYDASISWTSAPKLWEYYTKSKYNLGITAVRNARDCTIAANSGKIKPGDIIGFNSNNNGINHMAIVTSVGNGIIGYSAHTFSRDNVDLTTVFGKNPNYGTVNIMSLDYSEN